MLGDNSIMTFGRFKGIKLGDIPDGYWRWFLQQDWCEKYPEYIAYANCCDLEEEDE